MSRTTAAGGADFVPVDQRIATFDNDGTLWTEQPIHFQFAFAIDRVKALPSQHPEWKDREPFDGPDKPVDMKTEWNTIYPFERK